jgi:hypothetical protein
LRWASGALGGLGVGELAGDGEAVGEGVVAEELELGGDGEAAGVARPPGASWELGVAWDCPGPGGGCGRPHPGDGHPANQGANDPVFERAVGRQGDLDRLITVGVYGTAVCTVHGDMNDPEPHLRRAGAEVSNTVTFGDGARSRQEGH